MSRFLPKSRPRIRTIGGRVRRATAAAGGVLCALVAANLVVSAVVWKPTGYAIHPELGRIWRPGVYVQGVEGYSRSTLNSLGMRGPELPPRTAEELRILFLGDSLTEGFQVQEVQTFVRLTERKLVAEGRTVTAVNAGRSGASPAAYIHLAEWYLDVVDPDITVIQLSQQDFITDLPNEDGNFFVRRTENGFEAVHNEGFRSADPLSQRFPQLAEAAEVPVVRLVAENLSRIVRERQVTVPFLAYGASGEAQPADAEPSEIDPAVVDWVVETLSEQYSPLVIVYVPLEDYLHGEGGPEPVERLLERACAERRVMFIDMRPAFEQSFSNDFRTPTGFANSVPGQGHLNRTGHLLVSEELAPAILRAAQ